MASRAAQKDAARQARLAAEQAELVRAQRRRRLGVLSGVGLVAVIVVTVAIVVSSSGTPTAGFRSGASATGIVTSVAHELRGIPQSGATLGRSSAPVTVQYFGDLECPYCAALTVGDGGSGLPQLIAGPVRRGKVKLVYRSMETASRSTNNDRFIPQQVAALAAGAQGLFWQYTELFYHEQGDESSRYVTNAYLESLAHQVRGLNFSKWMSQRKNPALSAQITADAKLAVQDALPGTPTLIATGTQGSQIVTANSSGVESYADIMSAIHNVA